MAEASQQTVSLVGRIMSPAWLPSPYTAARRRWADRSQYLATLEYTQQQRRDLRRVVRRSVVFQAVQLNRMSGRSWLASRLITLAAVLTLWWFQQRAIIPAAGNTWDVLRVQLATAAGLTVGFVVARLFDRELVGLRNMIYRERPWLHPIPDALLWSIRIITAAAGSWFAAADMIGYAAGVRWGPALNLAAAFGQLVGQLLTGRYWRSHYGVSPSSAMAAETMLVVAGALKQAPERAWANAIGRKNLANGLQSFTLRTMLGYRRVARGAARSTGDRAELLNQASRLQKALQEHRRSLLDLSRQTEYDQLVDLIRQQAVDLARKNWDKLPAAADALTTRRWAAAIFSVSLATATGILINASSEHLPQWLTTAGGAYAALAVAVVVTIIATVWMADRAE